MGRVSLCYRPADSDTQHATDVEQVQKDTEDTFSGDGSSSSSSASGGVSGSAGEYVLYEWNIYYKNNQRGGVAAEIRKVQSKAGRMPDIIGLCESGGLKDLRSFASEIGTNYKWQAGSRAGYPYGTEIFYDTSRFTELAGMKTTVNRCGSKGGDRGANAVALKDKLTGGVLITGGMHTSYCRGGDCTRIFQCELGMLHKNLNLLRNQYGGGTAPVVFLGDRPRPRV